MEEIRPILNVAQRPVRPLHTRFRALGTRELAYLGLLLAVFGWGGAFIVSKLVLREYSALPAAAWRFVGAAALLAPFAWRQLRPGRATSLAGRTASLAGPLAVMVVCGGVLYPSMFMLSLERTSATNTSLIIAVMPVLTFLLCPLVGEKVPARRWFAVLLAMVGAGVVITRGDLAMFHGLSGLNHGDLIALGAAGVWAVFNLVSRKVALALPSSVINTLVFGIGGMALFALALPEGPVGQLRASSWAGVGGLMYLSLVPAALSGHLYLHGVRVLGVSRAVVFIYAVPFVTATLAALILDERLDAYQLSGGALIFVGLLLALEWPAVAD